MDLGACLRNKSMRVRVLPSALFEYGPVAQMDESACLRNQEVAGSSPAWVSERFFGLRISVLGFKIRLQFEIRDPSASLV